MTKADPLYLTEEQIAARVGLTAPEWKAVAPKLERAGLVRPDPVFNDRRYWPAVKDYLDRRNGLQHSALSAASGPEEEGSFR